MRSLIYSPNGVSLEEFDVRRSEARPKELQDPKYTKKYDYKTLFFDAYWVRPGTILIQGPPFLNLYTAISGVQVKALPSQSSCRFRVWEGERHSRIWVNAPEGTTTLSIEADWGTHTVLVRDNQSHLFADKRVLFTQSKNNDLVWLCDWVRYHRDVHGANAVILYDNASTDYSPNDIIQALGQLDGLDVVVAVAWNFPYGAQGGGGSFWDSDFSQSGVLEHARWMFLQQARSALSCDIDELVVTSNGVSIFEATEQSWTKTIRFRGAWMPSLSHLEYPIQQGETARHRDYTMYKAPQRRMKWGLLPRYEHRCASKWCVVPSQCPTYAQWVVHRIKRWPLAYPVSQTYTFRHFKAINTHWKHRRGAEDFDPNLHFEDEALLKHYNSVRWDR